VGTHAGKHQTNSCERYSGVAMTESPHDGLLGGQAVQRADDAGMKDVLRVLKEVQEAGASPDVLAAVGPLEDGERLARRTRLFSSLSFSGYVADGLLPAYPPPFTLTLFPSLFRGCRSWFGVIKAT